MVNIGMTVGGIVLGNSRMDKIEKVVKENEAYLKLLIQKTDKMNELLKDVKSANSESTMKKLILDFATYQGEVNKTFINLISNDSEYDIEIPEYTFAPKPVPVEKENGGIKCNGDMCEFDEEATIEA